MKEKHSLKERSHQRSLHNWPEALASSASSEGRAYNSFFNGIHHSAFPQNSSIPLRFNHLLENVSLYLSSSSNRRPDVCPSTFKSLRLRRSSQSIASGFLASGIL
ncbi:hypothetical protein YC2023_004688 [Brassica napus]